MAPLVAYEGRIIKIMLQEHALSVSTNKYIKHSKYREGRPKNSISKGGTFNLLGGDCSGLGGDKRRGDLGGLNKPHTVSNSSVMLVYSVCICINKAERPDGGITLIFGSVNVTLRSIDSVCIAAAAAVDGGSLLSGCDCVCENCLLSPLPLFEDESSPPIKYTISPIQILNSLFFSCNNNKCLFSFFATHLMYRKMHLKQRKH